MGIYNRQDCGCGEGGVDGVSAGRDRFGTGVCREAVRRGDGYTEL